jgi:ATP-dependent protease ClpP protease subunit
MQPKTIRIDGAIGTGPSEISAQMVRDQLPENGTDPIVVKIHSEGGNVFEGFAIHDALAAYAGPKSLSIESSAFSIASFIAMAFDDVSISPNGYMMLHNPYAGVEGDDEDLAKSSVLLAQLKTSMVNAYAIRSGRTEDEIRSILKDETYLNAEQSVAMGFATRVTGQSVIGRPFAKLSNLPHGVVAALFGAGSSGNQEPLPKEKPMSDSLPVAATLQEIKAAFPKAKAEFVVTCLEKSMPMASVASAAVEEMMAENEDLRAQIKAMEDEMAKAKAMEPSEEEEEVEAKAKAEYEDDEQEVEAKAKARSGVRPVAKSKTSGPSARVRWDSAVDSCLPKCNGNKVKAVAMANRNNPGLRQAYLDEVNS